MKYCATTSAHLDLIYSVHQGKITWSQPVADVLASCQCPLNKDHTCQWCTCPASDSGASGCAFVWVRRVSSSAVLESMISWANASDPYFWISWAFVSQTRAPYFLSDFREVIFWYREELFQSPPVVNHSSRSSCNLPEPELGKYWTHAKRIQCCTCICMHAYA